MRLPKSPRLQELRTEVQDRMGKRLHFCDIKDHPINAVRYNFGRYESSTGTVWVRTDLPLDVQIYVLAHELCHALVQASGYPRVSLVYKMKLAFKRANNHLRNVIADLHLLAGLISDLALDPKADDMAESNKLLTKPALQYVRVPGVSWSSVLLLPFDANRFRQHLDSVIAHAEAQTELPQHLDFVNFLYTAKNAVKYANQHLCLSRYDLWDKNAKAFDCYHKEIRKFGDKLFRIACSEDLLSSAGCAKTAKIVLDTLSIPEGILQIKANS